MLQLRPTTGLAIVLLLLGTSAASAQKPQTRKGFWIGFGLGRGSYDVSCIGCEGFGRKKSSSAHLRMGGTISPHVLLGGEVQGVYFSDSGLAYIAYNVTVNANYYPKPTLGLFLNGGVGLSVFNSELDPGEAGLGITLGAGYDLRVLTNISITPIASWSWGEPVSGFRQNFRQFGVGVTFH